MRLGRFFILGLMIATLSACSGLRQKVGLGKLTRATQEFDGQRFRGSAKGNRDDRHGFTATARPVSASAKGALASAEYQGIRYCIKYFGTSEIDWSHEPDSDPAALAIANDTLTLTGRCVE